MHRRCCSKWDGATNSVTEPLLPRGGGKSYFFYHRESGRGARTQNIYKKSSRGCKGGTGGHGKSGTGCKRKKTEILNFSNCAKPGHDCVSVTLAVQNSISGGGGANISKASKNLRKLAKSRETFSKNSRDFVCH